MHATTLVRSAGCAAILALILSTSTPTNPAPDPHAIRSKRERVLAASSAAESGRLMVVSLAHSLPQEPLAVPEVVVIPTLGTDHQFDLDYTVAHLEALLDAIRPDAIVLEDFTDWLRNGCVYQATAPETYVALKYAQRRDLPIWGTGWGRGDRPPRSDYDDAVRGAGQLNGRYTTPESVEKDYRRSLETTTARIAREFSFAPEPVTLAFLLQAGFTKWSASWSPARRGANISSGRQTADSVLSIIAANRQPRRWVVLMGWGRALTANEALQTHSSVRHRSVSDFMRAADRALANHMTAANIAWILSGTLDEWYGMWAPQVFPTQRIAGLLRQLQRLAPNDPTTRFLEARWLMQNRDYGAAEPVLVSLVDGAGDARFPFPINGKWVRPPWSSVRLKAMLNLAFLRDLQGNRDGALELYRQLLERGSELDAEARAAGYVFDDIRGVIESYTHSAYTGLPKEAFRHYRLGAAIPSCDPAPAR